MGIRTEYQPVIQCDFCGSIDVGEAYMRQKEAIKRWRKEGWSISRKVKCQKCKEETPKANLE